MAIEAGADGITVHLREDRRHIKDRDVERIRAEIAAPLNFEMAATEEMVAFAERIRPPYCCIVPEKRAELTTEGGLDVLRSGPFLREAVARLRAADVRVSIFIEADVEKDRVVLLAGFENLFTNNSANIDPTNVPIPPPKWKTLLVIYLILICNSIFWGTFISPLYMDSVPFPLFILISLFMDIVLTSYFSSPLMNKLFQDWLHSHTRKDIPKSWIGKTLFLGIPGLR